MLLKYRGVSYHAGLSSVHCNFVLSAIALTYRGTAYLLEPLASDHSSYSQDVDRVLVYRGIFYGSMQSTQFAQ